jgi:hypothetical protein
VHADEQLGAQLAGLQHGAGMAWWLLVVGRQREWWWWCW